MERVGQSCWALCIRETRSEPSQPIWEAGDSVEQTFGEGRKRALDHRTTGTEAGFSLWSI